MFVNLVLKEIKEQFKNITFYVFIAISVLFYATQFWGEVSFNTNLAPIPPQEYKEKYNGREPNYGRIEEKNPNRKMAIVYSRLLGDADTGSILKHGAIINKTVNLSEEQKEFMRKMANRISKEGYIDGEFKADVKYEELPNIMEEVDKYLGGGTYYSEKYSPMIFTKSKTYEEAVQEFNDIVYKDKITNAYGRIFADYMGTTAGLFPIFLGAFVLTRDKRYKMHELIYSRKITNYKYVFSKYIGLFLCIFIVYLALATHATIAFTKFANVNNYIIDYLAFYKYTLGWIAPTILFTLAIGFLISILFGNGIAAIPIQFGMWITSLLPLIGVYNLTKFVIRFNTVGSYDNYMKWKDSILLNRIFYVILSLLLVIVTSWVLAYKRGRGHGIFKKRSKASSI